MKTRIVNPLSRMLAPLLRFGADLVSSAALFLIIMGFTLVRFRVSKRRVQS